MEKSKFNIPGEEVSIDEKVGLARDVLRSDERNFFEPISFDEFQRMLIESPVKCLRDIQQILYLTIMNGVKELPNQLGGIDAEPLYDASKLFVKNTDHPFFGDYIFVARLIKVITSMLESSQQNKIITFNGPHGCGKTTFLNKIFFELQQFTRSEDGHLYEVVWRLNKKDFGERSCGGNQEVANMVLNLLNQGEGGLRRPGMPGGCGSKMQRNFGVGADDESDILEVPCLAHDHPILMIPREMRKDFFRSILPNGFLMEELSKTKYNWIFSRDACPFCSSMYLELLKRFKDPLKVFEMIYVRPYQFDRRYGTGISVFNPGDKPSMRQVIDNPILQDQLDFLFRDSNAVKYLFSKFAPTNNGIYALMDIKEHNQGRLKTLHNVISDGVFKVEETIEERIYSMFFAVMNPEDRATLKGHKSFKDRMVDIFIPYIRDVDQEVRTYLQTQGKHIEGYCLPGVLDNFAKVIISTRFEKESKALKGVVVDPSVYRDICDGKLELLRMEIVGKPYVIPTWLKESHQKELDAECRLSVCREADREGHSGISGRVSPEMLGKFIKKYHKEGELITTAQVCEFFEKAKNGKGGSDGFLDRITSDFLNSLQGMDNYVRLQQVKEALYFINEEEIKKDILNYLFSLNLELGVVEISPWTGDKLEAEEKTWLGFEKIIFPEEVFDLFNNKDNPETRRAKLQNRLNIEIAQAGVRPEESKLYKELYQAYLGSLKERVLEPFMENDNFLRGIKDYGTDDFLKYDRQVTRHVDHMIKEMVAKFGYTVQGAKMVCAYVVEERLARKLHRY